MFVVIFNNIEQSIYILGLCCIYDQLVVSVLVLLQSSCIELIPMSIVMIYYLLVYYDTPVFFQFLLFDVSIVCLFYFLLHSFSFFKIYGMSYSLSTCWNVPRSRSMYQVKNGVVIVQFLTTTLCSSLPALILLLSALCVYLVQFLVFLLFFLFEVLRYLF